MQDTRNNPEMADMQDAVLGWRLPLEAAPEVREYGVERLKELALLIVNSCPPNAVTALALGLLYSAVVTDSVEYVERFRESPL